MTTRAPAIEDLPSGLRARPSKVAADSGLEWMTGYGVWSLQFQSGDLFALRCFPSAGLGGFVTLWHQTPDLTWHMYVASETPEAACPRYFGAVVTSAEQADVDVRWEDDRTLHVRAHRRHMIDLDWRVHLGSSFRASLLNAMSAVLPKGAWRWPLVPRAMGAVATRVLDLGAMRLVGLMPNGQRFWLNPHKIYPVDSSSATLNGRDLGGLAFPQRVVWLGDYALPKRPLFAIGDSYAEPPTGAIPGILTTEPQDGERLLLSKYVCHRVVDRVLNASHAGTFGGQEVPAAVVFADLSGFTTVAERFDPEHVMSILNRNLGAIVETIFRYDGAVLKFLGDGVLAAFGVHLQRDDDAARAAAAALEIRDTLAALQEQVPVEERVGVSIGMHYGRVVSGNVGHENRLDFTIIGDTVNLASRLQGLAEPGQILVSDAFKERLSDEFLLSNRGEARVKGRTQLTMTYQLDGMRPDHDR
jgi:class 3 adenylate cyclase